MRWERYAGRDVIPLWVADTDFRAPRPVLDALSARVDHGVFGYTNPPEELRQAIVERLARRYGWAVDPAWVVFLPGVVPGLHISARRLLAPDEHALLPTPLYQHFKRALELAPRAHTEIALVLESGRWMLDLDALRRARTAKTRLVYLCNPQNPGGTVFRRDELLRLAELTPGCTIVSDEIHCDLVLDEGARHVPIASIAPEISRRTVTLMSANKAFNIPSAGCAWAVVEHPELREGDAWLAAQIEYLRGNRDLVQRELALPMAPVQATYLAWIDCTGLPAADPHEHFLRHGVALSPGAQFGAPRFVRLNFGTQRARLRQALARMQTALRSAG